MSEQEHQPKQSEHIHRRVGGIRSEERRQLFWVMTLTGVTMMVEGVAGIIAHSLALLSDAIHMLTHFGSIAVSYLAIVVSLREAPPEKTYRYWRFEVLAALFNAILLLPAVGYVLYEAYQRSMNPPEVDVPLTLGVAMAGLIVNLASAWILRKHDHEDVNMRSAFIHMVADTASSLGVLIAVGAVALAGWRFADPLMAAIIGAMILFWCVRLLRDSVRILLESAPPHIHPNDLERAIQEVDGVAGIHDLHLWVITSRMYMMTAHVLLSKDEHISDTENIGRRIRTLLDERFDITHCTLEFERILNPTVK